MTPSCAALAQELSLIHSFGTGEELEPEKDRVRGVVSMFGRETPVDLERDQVEPVKDLSLIHIDDEPLEAQAVARVANIRDVLPHPRTWGNAEF